MRDDAWSSPLEQPSAFVYAHPDGREVDVHVVRGSPDGSVETLWNVPYAFTPSGLSATGVVDGHEVRCLSQQMQVQAHTGYALPPITPRISGSSLNSTDGATLRCARCPERG